MIETLMKQLYFRDLRRRVEYLDAQRREEARPEIYLCWFDGDDRNDPGWSSAPTEKNGTAATPAPSPESTTPPGEWCHAQPTPLPESWTPLGERR